MLGGTVRAVAQSTATPSGDDGGTAGSGGAPVLSPDAIAGAVVSALKQLLAQLFRPIRQFLENNAGGVIRVVLDTPAPTRVFGAPQTTPWIAVYDYYWDAIVPVALLLFVFAGTVVILLETTSALFSSYHRAQLKRRGIVALLGVLSWWWINAFALRLVDGLVVALAPSLGDLTLFETASFGAIGLLGTVIALATDFALFGIVALVYLLRHVLIYFYTLLVPLLLVAWVPGVGPFRLLTGLVAQASRLYVPVLVMPVPVALLFRLGTLLGESAGVSSLGGFGAWVAALIIPFVAILAPIVLLWQTGQIAAAARTTARNISRRQAQARIGGIRSTTGTARSYGATGVQKTRETARGVRERHVVDAEGQSRFGLGGSRVRAAGQRIRRGVDRLGDRSAGGGDDTRGGTSDAGQHEPAEFHTDTTESETDQMDTQTRIDDTRWRDSSHRDDESRGGRR